MGSLFSPSRRHGRFAFFGQFSGVSFEGLFGWLMRLIGFAGFGFYGSSVFGLRTMYECIQQPPVLH